MFYVQTIKKSHGIQGGVKIKAAIFVLADIESHEGLGRVVNALEAVKQFKEAKDDVKLYFDGTGTKWISELNKKDHIVCLRQLVTK